MYIRKNLMSIVILLTLTVSFLPRQIKNPIFFLIFALCVVRTIKEGNFNIRKKKGDISLGVTIISVLLLVYSVFNMIINGLSIDSLVRLFQLFVSIFLLTASANYDWNDKDIFLGKSICQIVIIISFAAWIVSGFSKNSFSAIFTHTGGLGGAMFVGVTFIMLRENKTLIDKVLMVLAIILAIVANSRTMIGGIIIFYVVYFLLGKIGTKKMKWLFDVVILLVCFIPIAYMRIYESPLKDIFNEFSRTYFHKNFFSGRQHLWGTLTQLILNRPVIGYGLDVTPESLLGGTWSSHNWYLQVLLQMGIIGFVLLILLLRMIWRDLLLLNKRQTIISAGFLMGVLFWQCFEVSLTQNNFPSGIVVWLIFGIGLSEARKITPQNMNTSKQMNR